MGNAGLDIVLIRHADAVGAGLGYFGRTETPLSPRGRAQSARLALSLATFRPDVVWSSPALRARDTAKLAGLPAPQIDNDLREIDFGRWEGKTFDEIAASDPGKISDWAELKPDFAFPGGESLCNFEARVRRVADRIRGATCRRLAIVTHGGIVRYVLAELLRMSFDRVWIFSLPPGSIASVHLQDGYAQLNGLMSGNTLCDCANLAHEPVAGDGPAC